MKNLAKFTLIALATTLSLSSRAEHENSGRHAPMAVQVVFSSPGNGIDGETQTKVLELANDEIRAGRLTKLTVTTWGREGERTLCMEFKDFGVVRDNLQSITQIVDDGNKKAGVDKTSAKLAYDCSGTPPAANE